MPFTIRPYRRVPVYCPVTYQTGLFEGHGTVWNFFLTGWQFSGNLPLQIGEVCSLTINLPTHQPIYVAAGIVRWVQGKLGEDQEYGVETLVIDDDSREDVEEYLNSMRETMQKHCAQFGQPFECAAPSPDCWYRTVVAWQGVRQKYDDCVCKTCLSFAFYHPATLKSAWGIG